MFNCQKCNKEFEKATQLRGHRMRCGKLAKAEAPQESSVEISESHQTESQEYHYDKWQELPPPVIEWLKINFGGWLNHFEVGRTEYRQDFGGYGLYIKIPEQYSTEWKREQREAYDNIRRKPAVDEKGNPIRFEYVVPDVRYVSLQWEMSKVLVFLERIKNHIIENAHRKGIKLPSIGDEVHSVTTLENYKQSLYK